MNMKIRLFSKLLLILLLSFQVSHVMANTGKAFSIKGTAVINGSELTIADSIKEGDIIKTGANSSVQIMMKDRTVLDINENTRFQISKYSYNKDNPAKNKSSFALLKGTFRYISGLIAKNKPQNVQISAGTATIGIRGSFDSISYDGTNVNVVVSIGRATMTLANGEQITINSNHTGTANIVTGTSSVNPSISQDNVHAAALAIAANPTDSVAVETALSGLSDAEKIVAIAALISNTGPYGMDTAGLIAAVGNAAAASPTLAEGLSYMSSALDPANSEQYINTIQSNVDDSTVTDAAIQDAGEAGAGGGGGGGTGAITGSPS